MAIQELRQHLRIPTRSKAVIKQSDGARIRCSVHDMSMGGAYLVRSSEFGAPAEVKVDEVVSVTMFNSRSGSSYELEAEVVRVEPDQGAGLALRWRLSDQKFPSFEDHIHWEAVKQRVAPAALGVPILQYPHKKDSGVRRVARAVLPTTLIGSGVGLGSVAWIWLQTAL